MTREKIASLDKKILQISCPKWSQITAKTFFLGLHLISGKNDFNFRRRPFSCFWLFFPFRRRKYIISIKLFVKLVKAAKASHHTNFYNLSAVDEKIAISVDANIDWRLLPVCCCCSSTEQSQMQTTEFSA